MIDLSIIIPTFNRAERLRDCLDALACQTYAVENFEVIVVDDGSTDNTRNLLAGLRTPFALRALHQAREGQTPARNRGARAARGNHLLFLDDDIRAASTLVAAHVQAQRSAPCVVGIGALTMSAPPQSDWFARQFVDRWNAHYQHLRDATREVSWRDCYSGNLALPRDLFFASGEFATDLPAWFDLELGHRLQEHGAHFVFVADACGEHDDHKDMRRLLKANEAEGRSAPHVVREHPTTLNEIYGHYWEPTQRAVALRRALLRLNPEPSTLGLLGAMIPGVRWQKEWQLALQQYAFWRGVRTATSRDEWDRITSRTPILMYHAFGDTSERASRFVVPVHQFEQQLRWLKRHGYRFLSLQEYVCCLRHHCLPPARAAIITLDDGYADNFALALPLLKKYRVPATLFVVSDKVGQANDWDDAGELRGRPLLGWQALQAMAREGIEIGAHTRTHTALVDLSDKQIRAELVGSRAKLSDALQLPIRLFAYPYGAWNERVQGLAEAAGLLGSCTARPGLNTVATPPHALQRVEIRGTDALGEFARRVTGGR